MSLDYVELLAT